MKDKCHKDLMVTHFQDTPLDTQDMRIFEEVDLSTLTFDGEEEGEEGEEDIMLQREADSGGMVREEVAVAAAGEAGLLDEVGDEALFDEDEDIPDE